MDKIWEFWNYCAEEANKAVRLNFVCDDLFKDTYKFYKENLSLMEEQMFKTRTKNESIVYRNVCFDLYNNKNEEEFFEEPTFLSCFTDDFNTRYGSIQLKIFIPKGSENLRKENIMIVPAGTYQFIGRDENFYMIKLNSPKRIFSEEF